MDDGEKEDDVSMQEERQSLHTTVPCLSAVCRGATAAKAEWAKAAAPTKTLEKGANPVQKFPAHRSRDAPTPETTLLKTQPFHSERVEMELSLTKSSSLA